MAPINSLSSNLSLLQDKASIALSKLSSMEPYEIFYLMNHPLNKVEHDVCSLSEAASKFKEDINKETTISKTKGVLKEFALDIFMISVGIMAVIQHPKEYINHIINHI